MKIVTDCAADMPAEELEKLGIVQAPLFIQFPEGEVNSADITADAFYDRLEAMRPQIPTTAMPSTGLFAELYRKVAQAGEKIMSIHISSGLSGTINAAREMMAVNIGATAHLTSLFFTGHERTKSRTHHQRRLDLR